MPLWKLTLVDLLGPNWDASSNRGVRASREEVASDETEKAFGVKTRVEPGGGLKAPPWKSSALVSTEIVQDDR